MIIHMILEDLTFSYFSLFTNSIFTLISLADVGDWLILTGMSSYLPKFIEEQYQLSTGSAGQVVGLLVVIGGASSTILAGLFMKRFVHTINGAIKLCLLGQLINLPLMLIFLRTCPTLSYVGINYVPQLLPPPLGFTSSPICNSSVSTLSSFDPVCGSDKLMYVSPSHGKFYIKNLTKSN